MRGFIQYGLGIMVQQTVAYETRKEQLLERYEEIKKMPRKKKKQAKKHLLLDWSINEWLGKTLGIS